MKRLTALLAALMAIGMLTGPSVASELFKQLSPNTFGTADIPDGVSYEEFRGTIDVHYGVAPAWEVRTDEPLSMTEKQLRRQLSPNVSGYIADGVRDEEFRGPIDTHYGVAPAWEDRTEDPLERELRKQLSPNVHVDETSAF